MADKRDRRERESDRHRDRDRDRDRDRGRDRDRDRDRERERDRDRDKDRDRRRDNKSDRNRDRENDRDRDRSRNTDRDRDRRRNRSRSRSRERGRHSRSRSRSKSRSRSRSRSRSKNPTNDEKEDAPVPTEETNEVEVVTQPKRIRKKRFDTGSAPPPVPPTQPPMFTQQQGFANGVSLMPTPMGMPNQKLMGLLPNAMRPNMNTMQVPNPIELQAQMHMQMQRQRQQQQPMGQQGPLPPPAGPPAPPPQAPSLAKISVEQAVAQAQALARNIANGGNNPMMMKPQHVLPVASVIEKRKLLWGESKKANATAIAIATTAATTAATDPSKIKLVSSAVGGNEEVSGGVKLWASKSLEDDVTGDRKMKFLKLMGAGKSTSKEALQKTASTVASDNDGSKQLLNSLEHQFEESRMFSHTARGVGLGLYRTR